MNEGPQYYQLFFLGFVPFFSYYVGVCIRHVVFPSSKSRPLIHQFLIAIPLSILIIAPLLGTIGVAITVVGSWSGYLITIAIIIEHGIFMNEAVIERFDLHKAKTK